MFGVVSVDFPSKWAQLSDIVFKLIRCECVSRERWNASFGDVYALCNSRPVSHAPILYSSTTSLISARVKEIVAELKELDDSQLLPRYVHHWEIFHRGLTYLDNLYRFVNQQYVKNLRPTEAEMCYGAVLPMAERHTMEILEVGLAHWKLYLIDVIKDRLSSCLMREVLSDRMGISGQQSSIRPCIASFLRVGELRDIDKAGMDIYNEIFQNPLLEATETYYSNWASQRESTLSCSNYVTEALALREVEETRALHYYKCSFEKIQSLFQDIIVKQRLDFLNQSVRTMVSEENKTDLLNLFQLLAPNSLYSELSHWFGQHVMTLIREAIMALPQDSNLAPTHFVESLLSIRNRFIHFIDEVFDGMNSFRNQMDRAFNLAINDRNTLHQAGSSGAKPLLSRPSELLSRYMDSLLRRSGKYPSESEVEAKLTASISIFKYIDDKDAFQKYYQRMLCKRLISNASCAMELEESVINQLKAVCGYEFTGKFHRMFNDVQLASEMNRNFSAYLDKQAVRFTFGHHFNVLTQCSWPISLTGSAEFLLPSELQQCTAQFEAFYSSSFQGRKMHWAHNYSTVELSLLYADKPYQLQAPALHAAVLLLFDTVDSDRILLKDLYATIQLNAESHRPSTASTSHAEGASATDSMDTSPSEGLNSNSELEFCQRMLLPLMEMGLIGLESDGTVQKTIHSNTLTPETVIVLNRLFTNKRLKIRVNFSAQTKETVQVAEDPVDRQVNEDRRYFIQAAIVRIMKARKQIEHGALIECVLQQASGRFQPPIPLVKRCIETLIDKGYLERNPDNPCQYSYLA
ncbi:unnamed protein product [Calicophoron daubneyi]|uniref:Cullin family profile domain-containing protein n=1 Tax=Calicophoron daubneyi TaxID=300641 RepID=A0AAV2SXQ6_CALDB